VDLLRDSNIGLLSPKPIPKPKSILGQDIGRDFIRNSKSTAYNNYNSIGKVD
jgi:hypothetical protein